MTERSEKPAIPVAAERDDKQNNHLRDRIIAALVQADQDWCSDNPLYEDEADAVIRELEADYILVPKSHTLARNAFKYGEHYGI